MIRLGLVSIALIACSKPPPSEWRARAKDNYVVTAPGDPIDHSIDHITTHLYVSSMKMVLEVQRVDAPATEDPARMLAKVRDQIARTGTILSEKPLAVGDLGGYDLVYRGELPLLGKARVHNRLMFHTGHIYQVMSGRFVEDGDAGALDADGDRFVESFAFTDKALDPTAVMAANPSTALTVHPHAAGAPGTDGWYQAHSSEGHYSVRLPAPYVDADIDVEKDTGKPANGMIMYSLVADRGSDHVKFFTTCLKSDGRPAADRLQTYVAAVSKGLTASELRLGANPATDLTGAHIRIRILALADRTCMLQVEPLSQDTPVPQADAQRLFESFAVDM